MRRRLVRASRVVAYPLLAAAYPVVALYALNLREMIPLAQTFAPILIAVGVAATVLVVLRLALGDWHRAGLMTTLLVVLFFTYGIAWDALREAGWAAQAPLVVAWTLLAAAGFLAVRRLAARRVASVTPALNVVAAVLVIANVAAIAGFHLDVRGDVRVAGAPTGDGDVTPIGPARDIYWIILDRYGSQEVIEEYYGHDISPFVEELRDRGFYVADDATANYLKTAPSLVSARNMDYLDGEALRERASADDDWGPLYRDLSRTFPLLEILRQVDYRFVYLGTYWQFTASHPEADVNYVYDEARSEFSSVLADTTLLRVREVFDEAGETDWRRERWLLTRFQWDRMRDAIGVGSPKLVHAHFSLPHDPYVFHADGSFVAESTERERSTAENYADQVEYANRAVLDFLDELLATDPENQPIVIVQAEEGPWPERYRANEPGFRWADEATDEELHEKFGVLSAFYLPELPGDRAEEAGLYPSITLVNQFRVILNHYFGTDYELLPDRNYIWADQDAIYDFIDVTDRVRRMTGATD